MKNKTWFTISAISALWIFLTTLLYTVMGAVLLLGTEEGKEALKHFVSGEFNTNFIMIMSTGCMFASSIVCTFIISLSKQSDKLDNLDEATQKYYEAKQRLEQKINKL